MTLSSAVIGLPAFSRQMVDPQASRQGAEGSHNCVKRHANPLPGRRVKSTKSVTKGSGTNDESMNDAQRIPSPPSAGKFAVDHDLSCNQPTAQTRSRRNWENPRLP